jgi:glutamate/tyrosine decarboxylase-like PLP-dependent enzyme
MDGARLDLEARLARAAAGRLLEGFDALPGVDAAIDADGVARVLEETAVRLQGTYPFHHPLYAGQMLKPPHPVARLAYALAMQLNPNNHALDGGPAASLMEKEAVAGIARMLGFDRFLGHLCGGGTLANLEALWVAGRLHPGKRVLASAQAHYTHARLSEVLGIPFTAVAVDGRARIDAAALEQELAQGDVGTVVATLGTTALGAVDPLPRILELARAHDCRVHVDAAYGGYFGLVDTLDEDTRAAFAAVPGADSCVIDPHKHGLQPYGCGCVLFADPAVGRFYVHDSPYTYFSSEELHLGEISLECSRAGAAAAALWATQRLLPLERDGSFARDLTSGCSAARDLHARIRADHGFLPVLAPELDIVAWAPRAATASEISRRTRRLFARAARHDLHLSVTAVPATLLRAHWDGVDFDEERVSCLRSCLMKPAHAIWLGAIWRRLLAARADEEATGWR